MVKFCSDFFAHGLKKDKIKFAKDLSSEKYQILRKIIDMKTKHHIALLKGQNKKG